MTPQGTYGYVQARKRALRRLIEEVETRHEQWARTCMGVFISQEELDKARARDQMVFKEHRIHQRMFARHMRQLDRLEKKLVLSGFRESLTPMQGRHP